MILYLSKKKKCYLLFFLLQLLPYTICSLDSLVLTDSQGIYQVATYFEYLEDPGNKLSITEISSKEWENKFIKNNKTSPNFGYSKSSYWVKFKIKNDSSTQKKWLLKMEYTWFKKIEFYQSDNNGKFLVKNSSYKTPQELRDVRHRKIIFTFILNTNEEKTYYMKFSSLDSFLLSMTIYSYDNFLNEDHGNQLFYGIFFGIIIIFTM
jgi:two-component system, sensor histidine kinase LadS